MCYDIHHYIILYCNNIAFQVWLIRYPEKCCDFIKILCMISIYIRFRRVLKVEFSFVSTGIIVALLVNFLWKRFHFPARLVKRSVLYNVSKTLNTKSDKHLTSLFVRYPTTYGPTIPGIVATVLVIPIRTPAYLGAISKWLTIYEDLLRAVMPRASENKTTASVVLLQPT